MKKAPQTFPEIILALQDFWRRRDCVVLQPLDCEVGAGTFHPATFLRAVSKKPWRAAYVQPSRRPQDGRGGDNPNRLQHYYQFQTALKPPPDDFQDLFLRSLADLGIRAAAHDIRFVEDDWESPTLGAWGMGWEVWIDGMEVAQFTYFQEAGGIVVDPVMGEITYGLERLALFVLGRDNVFDLPWTLDRKSGAAATTYGDVFLQNEKQQSEYNFHHADCEKIVRRFDDCEAESRALSEKSLPLPAYDLALKCSHAFNLLDARGVISVTERAHYIARVRALARAAARSYRALEDEADEPKPLPPPRIRNERINLQRRASARENAANRRVALPFARRRCPLVGGRRIVGLFRLQAGDIARRFFAAFRRLDFG